MGKRTPAFPLVIPKDQREIWEKEAEKRFLNLSEFIRQMVEKGLQIDKKQRGE